MALYKWNVRIAGIGSFPDQIQYMSQDDYDNLSEETKMNGTTYGIIWNWTSDWLTSWEVTSLTKFFRWWWTVISLSWKTINTAWESFTIPADCNIIYINLSQNRSVSQNWWWLWATMVLTKWLPSSQWAHSFHSDGSYYYWLRINATVNWSWHTLTLRWENSSWVISAWSITFC
jgi:hypothetical protein